MEGYNEMPTILEELLKAVRENEQLKRKIKKLKKKLRKASKANRA